MAQTQKHDVKATKKKKKIYTLEASGRQGHVGGLGWQKRGLGLPGPPGPSADPSAVPLGSGGKGWGSWLPAHPKDCVTPTDSHGPLLLNRTALAQLC